MLYTVQWLRDGVWEDGYLSADADGATRHLDQQWPLKARHGCKGGRVVDRDGITHAIRPKMAGHT